MQLIVLGIATLSIAALYYIWRSYHGVKIHHERRLRERVAYMLWKAAERESNPRIPVVPRPQS